MPNKTGNIVEKITLKGRKLVCLFSLIREVFLGYNRDHQQPIPDY